MEMMALLFKILRVSPSTLYILDGGAAVAVGAV